jgi:hypothetical protein
LNIYGSYVGKQIQWLIIKKKKKEEEEEEEEVRIV